MIAQFIDRTYSPYNIITKLLYENFRDTQGYSMHSILQSKFISSTLDIDGIQKT